MKLSLKLLKLQEAVWSHMFQLSFHVTNTETQNSVSSIQHNQKWEKTLYSQYIYIK